MFPGYVSQLCLHLHHHGHHIWLVRGDLLPAGVPLGDEFVDHSVDLLDVSGESVDLLVELDDGVADTVDGGVVVLHHVDDLLGVDDLSGDVLDVSNNLSDVLGDVLSLGDVGGLVSLDDEVSDDLVQLVDLGHEVLDGLGVVVDDLLLLVGDHRVDVLDVRNVRGPLLS